MRAVVSPLFLGLFITRESVDGASTDRSADAAPAAARAGVFNSPAEAT
ncbi:hypothetical protein ACH4CE_28710 [Streptomyces gelaticus]